jgi:hypothetical protein
MNGGLFELLSEHERFPVEAGRVSELTAAAAESPEIDENHRQPPTLPGAQPNHPSVKERRLCIREATEIEKEAATVDELRGGQTIMRTGLEVLLRAIESS